MSKLQSGTPGGGGSAFGALGEPIGGTAGRLGNMAIRSLALAGIIDAFRQNEISEKSKSEEAVLESQRPTGQLDQMKEELQHDTTDQSHYSGLLGNVYKFGAMLGGGSYAGSSAGRAEAAVQEDEEQIKRREIADEDLKQAKQKEERGFRKENFLTEEAHRGADLTMGEDITVDKMNQDKLGQEQHELAKKQYDEKYDLEKEYNTKIQQIRLDTTNIHKNADIQDLESAKTVAMSKLQESQNIENIAQKTEQDRRATRLTDSLTAEGEVPGVKQRKDVLHQDFVRQFDEQKGDYDATGQVGLQKQLDGIEKRKDAEIDAEQILQNVKTKYQAANIQAYGKVTADQVALAQAEADAELEIDKKKNLQKIADATKAGFARSQAQEDAYSAAGIQASHEKATGYGYKSEIDSTKEEFQKRLDAAKPEDKVRIAKEEAAALDDINQKRKISRDDIDEETKIMDLKFYKGDKIAEQEKIKYDYAKKIKDATGDPETQASLQKQESAELRQATYVAPSFGSGGFATWQKMQEGALKGLGMPAMSATQIPDIHQAAHSDAGAGTKDSGSKDFKEGATKLWEVFKSAPKIAIVQLL